MTEISAEAEGKIIDLLIDEGLVDYGIVDSARQRAMTEGGSVLGELIAGKMVSSDMVSHATAVIAGIPSVELKNIEIDQEILGKITRDAALRVTAVPIGEKDGVLNVAMLDAGNVQFTDYLASLANQPIRVWMSSERGIHEAIDQYHGDFSGVSDAVKETTVAAVILDPERRYKYALMSFPLIPHYAVLDAQLTVSLPPALTATTGMDALCHAVEAYIGRSTTKQTRKLALEATKMVFQNIEIAYENGNCLEARKNMLHAAHKGGLAFSKSYVGYIHAVGHSLTGQYGISHGLVNAVLMPYVLECYGACIHKKLHQLGVAAGVCLVTDSHSDGAEKFIQALKDLNLRLGIPEKLSQICAEDIPNMAKHAAKEANPLYPVPKLMTSKELEKLYYQIGE